MRANESRHYILYHSSILDGIFIIRQDTLGMFPWIPL